MSTHIGKIGRLSKERREELGERMEDGQTGKELAEWLNSLPEVQALLKAKFGGRPVNEQNVSNWRLSGHKDWLRLREARARVLRLVEDEEELSAVAGGHRLGDCLAAILAVELDGLGRALLGDEEADLEKRWERFCEVHRQVSRLRRDDDRVKRTSLREKALHEKAIGDRLRARGGEAPRMQKEELRMKNGDLAGVQGPGTGTCEGRGIKNEERGSRSPACHSCEPAEREHGTRKSRELAGWKACATGAEKSAERPANQDKSRQIKVENQSKGQGPGTGDGEGRGIIGRGIKNEERGSRSPACRSCESAEREHGTRSRSPAWQ